VFMRTYAIVRTDGTFVWVQFPDQINVAKETLAAQAAIFKMGINKGDGETKRDDNTN
jgi:hypothetical protein